MKFSKGFLVVLGVLAVLVALCAPPPFKIGSLLLGLPLVFGTVLTDSDIARWLTAFGILDTAGGLKMGWVVKTGNYSIVAPTAAAGDRSGTQFTNRGAGGAVTFTLPVITAALAGTWYDFWGVVAQTLTVAAAAGTVVTFNNAAATSLAASTGGQQIGAHIRAVCDGTSWHLDGDRVGVTYTVA